MHTPMREKYLDEAIGHYFIFGTYEDGTVDVSDGQKDVLIRLDPTKAQEVCDAHAEFRAKLYNILCK